MTSPSARDFDDFARSTYAVTFGSRRVLGRDRDSGETHDDQGKRDTVLETHGSLLPLLHRRRFGTMSAGTEQGVADDPGHQLGLGLGVLRDEIDTAPHTNRFGKSVRRLLALGDLERRGGEHRPHQHPAPELPATWPIGGDRLVREPGGHQ